MLKIDHISKTFYPGTENEKRALQDLSLTLDKGDFVYQAEITEYRENMTTIYIAALDELQPKS